MWALSCSMQDLVPDQGSNPCPLHWQADSQPLCHQGSPGSVFWLTVWPATHSPATNPPSPDSPAAFPDAILTLLWLWWSAHSTTQLFCSVLFFSTNVYFEIIWGLQKSYKDSRESAVCPSPTTLPRGEFVTAGKVTWGHFIQISLVFPPMSLSCPRILTLCSVATHVSSVISGQWKPLGFPGHLLTNSLFVLEKKKLLSI